MIRSHMKEGFVRLGRGNDNERGTKGIRLGGETGSWLEKKKEYVHRNGEGR